MNEPRRLTKKAAATRTRILDAAAAVFRSHGYAGTRLADVAAVAMTQTGSLYYYFSSREELVEEVLRVGQERASGYVRRRVAALPENAVPLEQLNEAIAAHLATILELGDYTAATIRILGQVPEEIRRRMLHEQREYGQFWRALFDSVEADGQLRGDIDSSAARMLVLGAVNSTTEWFSVRDSRLSSEDFQKQVVAIFLEGLATEHPSVMRSLDRELSAIEIARDRLRYLSEPDSLASGAERILDAAAAVFRERGYAGTRLADVAAAANIQTSTMYHHFTSREDLVRRLLLRSWRRTNDLVRGSVRALPQDATHLQRFSTAMTAHTLSVLERSEYTSALVRILGQVPEAVRVDTVPQQRAYLQYLQQLYQDAAAAGEARSDLDVPVTLMTLMGSVNWSVEWYREDGELSREQLATHFISLVLDGLVRHTDEAGV